MLKPLLLTFNWLKYYFSSVNEHSIHSPFVFSLLTDGIYKKTDEPEFKLIEQIRNELLHDNHQLRVTDLGAGSTFDGIPKTRAIKEIAANFAKSKRYCRLLFRLTRHLKPASMIELGTSLGISAMYQSAGNPEAILYTLEGCPETAETARQIFQKNHFTNIRCITGNFDDTLPELLSKLTKLDYIFIDGNHTYDATMRYFEMCKPYLHENSVIIFDDINWSEGMKQAWREIQGDEKVRISVDLFMVGVVFFNPGLAKQAFLIRY